MIDSGNVHLWVYRSLYGALICALFACSSGVSAAEKVEYGYFTSVATPEFSTAYGVYPALGEERATIIFFPGFTDVFRYHEATFAHWQAAGVTVLAFDYPDHGGTKRLGSKSINSVKFSELVETATELYERNIRKRNKPLFLAGISTGGLIVARSVQSSRLRAKLPKTPIGVVLFAPAISAKPCIGVSATQGEFSCIRANHRTLTHDERLWSRGEIRPSNAIKVAGFVGQLFIDGPKMFNFAQAWPQETKVYVSTAGDDRYVFSNMTNRWRETQQKIWGMKAVAVHCDGAFHEMDNDTPFGAEAIRRSSAKFIEEVLAGTAAPNISEELQTADNCYLQY